MAQMKMFDGSDDRRMTLREIWAEHVANRPAVPLNSTVDETDMRRLSAQHETILDALRDGPKTNLELELIAQRFSARLHELKRAGHHWTKRCVKPGVYEYRLLDEGNVDAGNCAS